MAGARATGWFPPESISPDLSNAQKARIRRFEHPEALDATILLGVRASQKLRASISERVDDELPLD